MRKNYLWLLILFMGVSEVFSQADFRQGYIISNEEDTVFGLIDYRSEDLNCSKCTFKKSEEDQPTIYLPADIKAYRFIDGKYYISGYSEDLKKKVFFEYLIDGIVDIYYFKDVAYGHYFIGKDNGEFNMLENKKIETVIDGQTYVRNSNRHIGLLNYYLSDSKEIKDRIKDVELKHNSLIELSKDYHNQVCSDQECIVFEKKMPPFRFEIGALVFVNYSDFNITNSYYSGFGLVRTKKDMDWNLGYEIGLGGSMYLPRLNERVSIYFQMLYGENHFDITIEEIEQLRTKVTKEDYYIRTLTKDIGFKYKFPSGKLRPEFLLGYSRVVVNARDKSRVKGEEVVEYLNEIYEIDYKLEYPEGEIVNGFFLGAGLNFFQFGKFDLNVNLQYNYHLSNSDIRMNNIRLGLGITY